MAKKPRTKAYRPKTVHLPVMQDLFDQFDRQLLMSETALSMRMEHHEDWHIRGLAEVFNLLSTYLAGRRGGDRADLRLIGAINVVQRWTDAFGKAGFFFAREHDVLTVHVGVQSCREHLLTASVVGLYEAMQILRTKQHLEAIHARVPRDGKTASASPEGGAAAAPAGPGGDQEQPAADAVPRAPGSGQSRHQAGQETAPAPA